MRRTHRWQRMVVAAGMALLAAFPALAVRAPFPRSGGEAAASLRRGALRRPTTDLTHLRTSLAVRPSANGRLLRAEPELPVRWDSRERGWVSPVKNQGSYGTCWAFAAAAAMESSVLKASGGAVTNDYSENHLATHDVGFGFGFSDGGNHQLSAALLTSWRDPVWETDDPYPDPGSAYGGASVAHVQDIVWLPARFCPAFASGEWYAVGAREDNREVDAAYKRAVMEFGALGVSYYHCHDCCRGGTGAHCWKRSSHVGSASDGGHAVTLVGWDDEYPAENFKPTCRPKRDGAFLVKNSWGTGNVSTTNGYLWISYEDEGLFMQEGEAYPPPEAAKNYARIYQYDPCGQVTTWNSADTLQEARPEEGFIDWCANVFNAVATGVVEAVGFYALADETKYVLKAYAGNVRSPVDGTLVCAQTGTVARAGFTTVRLATPVALKRVGEKFAVVLALRSPGTDYPLAVECTFYDGAALWCATEAGAGESFMSKDGVGWVDFQKYDPTGNFCLKAYTRQGVEGPVCEPLVESAMPDVKTVARLTLGQSRRFSVATRKPGCTYAWRVNGNWRSETREEFVFEPGFADHGVCEVGCVVRRGESVEVVKWTAMVNSEICVATNHVDGVRDGSPERPFARIADACAAAIEGDRILVAQGVYRETIESPSARIGIGSLEGPAKTLVDAQGLGRCYYGGQNAATALVGFTLRNGRASDGTIGGGACGGTLTNCVIENCTADQGGGAANAELVNCLLVRNVAKDLGGGICNCLLVNCTVAGNRAENFAGGAWLDAGYRPVNSVFSENRDGRGKASDGIGDGFSAAVGCFNGEAAGFVDPGAGDWHLSARSPCLDAGENEHVATEQDLDGERRISGTRVDCGCYEYCGFAPGWPPLKIAAGATAGEEAAAVSNALAAAGFDGEKAAALTTAAQYAAFTDWAERRAVAPTELAVAGAAYASAALDAERLLSPQEVLKMAEFERVRADSWSRRDEWRLLFRPEGYAPEKVLPSLANVSFGISASPELAGRYSDESFTWTRSWTKLGLEFRLNLDRSQSWFVETRVK